MATAHRRVGEAALASGDARDAQAALEVSIEAAKRARALEPSNAGPPASIAAARASLGDVAMKQGRLADAIASYREAIAIVDERAAANPKDLDVRSTLAELHLAMASAHARDAAAALAEAQTGLELADAVLQADPSRRRNVAVRSLLRAAVARGQRSRDVARRLLDEAIAELTALEQAGSLIHQHRLLLAAYREERAALGR